MIAASFLGIEQAHAAVASPERVLRRCYSQLTGSIPPRRYLQQWVRSHPELPAVEFCVSLLNRTVTDELTGLTEFDPSPRGDLGDESIRAILVQTPTAELNQIASSILKQMHSFHQGWFSNDQLDAVLKDGDNYQNTDLLYDESQGALTLDHILLGQGGVPYSRLVTGNRELQAIRSSGSISVTQVPFIPNPARPSIVHQFNLFEMQAGPKDSPADLGIHRGELLGVRELPADSVRSTLAIPYFSSSNPASERRDLRFSTHLGGGLLGSSPFLLLNLRQSIQDQADGGLVVARAFSRTVFQDLLCRSLPVVRSSDALTFVEASSSLAFRQGRSCMACHSSMDGFAGGFRKVQILQQLRVRLANGSIANTSCPTDRNPTGGGTGPCGSYHINPLPAPVAQPSGVPPLYRAQEPDGLFFIRSIEGDLINQTFRGVSQAGELLRNSLDLYTCASRRYLQYFTGVLANIEEVQSFTRSNPNSRDQEARAWVLDLGRGLKQDPEQSLKAMITSILRDPRYHSLHLKSLLQSREGQSEGGISP